MVRRDLTAEEQRLRTENERLQGRSLAYQQALLALRSDLIDALADKEWPHGLPTDGEIVGRAKESREWRRHWMTACAENHQRTKEANRLREALQYVLYYAEKDGSGIPRSYTARARAALGGGDE